VAKTTAHAEPFSIPCVYKRLPEHALIPAARAATEENPANAPPGDALSRLEKAMGRPATPQHIALMTNKKWPPGGKVFPTYFMDTTDAALRNKILAFLNEPNRVCNLKFVLTGKQSDALVRITRTPGEGYWSFVGPDILQIPNDEPTMNLESFTVDDPSDAEYMRVVPHEGLHTGGCIHEHQRKAIIDLLDKLKVEAWLSAYAGWTVAEVDQQVFVYAPEEELTATPFADPSSVMAYAFPASVTKNGVAIPGGSGLTQLDKDFLARMYPLPVAPPPPPPPPVVGNLFSLTFARDVHKGDIIRFASPKSFPAGKYIVVPAAPGAAEPEHAVTPTVTKHRKGK
jgi:hypothetical protein